MCLANTHKVILFKAVIYVGDSPVISRDANINSKRLKTLTVWFFFLVNFGHKGDRELTPCRRRKERKV